MSAPIRRAECDQIEQSKDPDVSLRGEVIDLYIYWLVERKKFKAALAAINIALKRNGLSTHARFERIEILKRSVSLDGVDSLLGDGDSSLTRTDLLDQLFQESVQLARFCSNERDLAKSIRNCTFYFRIGGQLDTAIACALKSLFYESS